MIWLIGAAAFVVSVDSGPMHIAAAIKARMLSIHTWSDPRLVGPFSDEAWIWQGGKFGGSNFGAPSLLPARSPGTADILQIARIRQADRPRRQLTAAGMKFREKPPPIQPWQQLCSPSLALPSTR